MSFDTDLFIFINKTFHTDLLNIIFVFLTKKSSIVLPILLVGLYVYNKDKKKGILLLLVSFIAVGLSDFLTSGIIKPIVDRDRPCQVIPDIYFWNKKGNPDWFITDGVTSFKGSDSFPSSHASNTMAFAIFMGLYYRRLLIPLIIIAFLVGVSRIYVGVHYPSDVLGGFVAGIFMAYLVKYLFELVKKKIINKISE